MYFKYLQRELNHRRKQTALVASGLALAVGLVTVVNAASTGVANAQDQVLDSLYGIGTDIAISETVEMGAGGGRQQFDIGSEAGETEDGSRTFSRSRLTATPGQATLTAEEYASVAAVDGVANTTATLKLTSVTFNGELPEFMITGERPEPGSTVAPSAAPTGGADGSGGSAFDITTFTVEGVDPAVADLGPLSAVGVNAGRLFTTADAGTNVALLDYDYATSQELAVGDTITFSDTEFEIVGVIKSTSTTGTSASNVYIPLDVAQTLSALADQVSNIFVAAESADVVAEVDAALTTALPDATVNSASELANGVSGSLSDASGLLKNLGTWLSYLVLGAAFLIASLLTASGVNRRTREFGTLKAIGWRSRRIVGQVLGESLVTGIIGGIAGLGLGAAGIWAVNTYAPSLTASTSSPAQDFMARGPFGAAQEAASAGVELAIDAALSPSIALTAILLAVAGGVIAGVYGGWRAARLSPAESLRSVA